MIVRCEYEDNNIPGGYITGIAEKHETRFWAGNRVYYTKDIHQLIPIPDYGYGLTDVFRTTPGGDPVRVCREVRAVFGF